MLKMRLQRIGRKNDPKYRIVVTNSTNSPVTKKHIDLVGSYDAKVGKIELKADKIKHWLSVGVKPSDTVHNMLVKNKVIDAKTVNALPRKTPVKKEEEKK